MMLRALIKRKLSQFLIRRGKEIVPAETLYEWQRDVAIGPTYNAGILPGDAASYLRPDNQKLIDLQKRYGAFDPDVTAGSVWRDGHVRGEDIAYFRGDNAWVWQVRGNNANILAYGLAYYYAKSIDRLGLLERLTEDDSFGNFTFRVADRLISRDLLDSIFEIYFLDRHLGIGSASDLCVLDIGAGYGRLAYRMVKALPGIRKYLCTDAVPASTFINEYYLNFRHVTRAEVIPLDEIEQVLSRQTVDFAVNIHSFSECEPKAIEWWAGLLSRNRVKHLMIAPNCASGTGDRLLTNDGREFLPVLEKYGYRLVLKEPKYLDPLVQKYAPYPTWHHLLELKT